MPVLITERMGAYDPGGVAVRLLRPPCGITAPDHWLLSARLGDHITPVL